MSFYAPNPMFGPRFSATGRGIWSVYFGNLLLGKFAERDFRNYT
jgi:hypothetical protein